MSLKRLSVLALLVCASACGDRPAAEAPAVPDPTPAMTRHYADLLGCSGIPGATLSGWDVGLRTVQIGGPEPVLVVDPGRLRCSQPSSNMYAGSQDLVFWRASELKEREPNDGMNAYAWTAENGAIRAFTAAGNLCPDAPFPLPATGACGFEVRWDVAADRTAQTYRWDPTATRPAPQRATLPRGPDGDRAIDCADFSGSEDVIPPEALTRTDIDRDGREDLLVVDYANARCTVGGGPFLCGTGGCPLQVWMAAPDGALVKTIDEQLLRWRVPGAPGVIEAQVHGGRCGGAGSDPCLSTYTWNATARRFDIRSEPRAYTP